MTTFVSQQFSTGAAIESALLKAESAAQPESIADALALAESAVQPSALTPLENGLAELNAFSFKPKTYRVGFAGDSIGQGIGKTSFQSSFLAWNHFSDAPYDIEWDSRLYSEGGYNFAVGGANTSTILATQAPQIEARPPEILFVNGGTNNGISSIALANAAFSDMQALITAALAAGVKSVLVYPIIPKSSNDGNNTTVNSVSYFNARLLKLCESDRRLVYLNPDPYLASGSSKFHMPRANVSTDGTHLSGYGSYVQRDLLEGVLPRRTRHSFAGNPGNIWHATNNPLGNVLGDRGYFIEGGGLLNAVANPDVGKEWLLTATGGLVATPTIVDSDVFPGFKCQRIDVSGTASSTSALVKLQTSYYNELIFASENSWNFEFYIRCKNFVSMPPPSVSFQTTGGDAALAPVYYRYSGGAGSGIIPANYLTEDDHTFYFRNTGPIITNSGNRKFDLWIELGTVNGQSPTGAIEVGMVSVYPAEFGV